MSVRTAWKIHKLSTLPISPEIRQKIFTDLKRKVKSQVTLYSWDYDNSTAKKAFFSKREAARDWVKSVGMALHKSGHNLPPNVRLIAWVTEATEVVPYIKDRQLLGIPIVGLNKKTITIPINPKIFSTSKDK